MVVQFIFPDVGEGIHDGEIVEWLVKEGDSVKEDQNIVKVETDKAVVELPSPTTGIILKIYPKAGETIKVGEVMVDIGDKGEKAPKVKKPKSFSGKSVVGELEEAPEEPVKKKNKIEYSKIKVQVDKHGKVIAVEGAKAHLAKKIVRSGNVQLSSISPPTSKVSAMLGVRKIAKDKGLDLSIIKGSGKDNRILASDLGQSSTSHGDVVIVPLKGLRKTIAENMTKQLNIPTATHMDEFDTQKLYKLREREKKRMSTIKLTYLPFIIKAVTLALKKYPSLNSHLEGENIIVKKYYNIGIAVATEGGLMVPVVKDTDKKSIMDIAKEIEDLAQKARDRTITLEELKGSTFTITNVGSIGGLFAHAIINPGNSAILALGRMYDKPVIFGNKIKTIKVRKTLPISLTFDHRVLDGADAALFANAVKEYLEDPDSLLLDLA